MALAISAASICLSVACLAPPPARPGVETTPADQQVPAVHRGPALALVPDSTPVDSPPVAGASACGGCHDRVYAGWLASSHAQALDRLAPAARRNASCARCHASDGKPENETARPGVDCEACHANGCARNHSMSQNDCPLCPLRAQCIRCHTPDRSPEFDLTAAWHRVQREHRRQQ